MKPVLQHLHTYFLFPFSIDKEVITEGREPLWAKYPHWIDGLDEWIASFGTPGRSAVVDRLGAWQRAAYAQFDMDSPAYQDMVFFHPYVRRIFFDTLEMPSPLGERVALIRCYTIPVGSRGRVWMQAEDVRGRSAKVEVTDLRLFLFANGMGILSIGIEAHDILVSDALWINEQMRKIYPSSGRQLREGRGLSRVALLAGEPGKEELVAEETYRNASMLGFQPPLSSVITSLLYFMDYERAAYEQLLDERMIVYSYAAVDPATVRADIAKSEEYQVFLSRLLYVETAGETYRYEPEFLRGQMKQQVYTRWAHEGTYYGFTSYSNVTLCLGAADRGEHSLQEGFLIHRMFDTKYYLMALVALFYRATLLDFAEKSALVSKRLYRDQAEGEISPENVAMASALRAEFLHFSNYWYFEELANKDEESEHFNIQCRAYKIGEMKAEVEDEIETLNAALHEYYQNRNTRAVNRLAVLSVIFGAGAVVTGFFGMNFGREFGKIFFEPESRTPALHYLSIAWVIFLTGATITFAAYLMLRNWGDYRDIMGKRRGREQDISQWYSLKKIEFPQKVKAARRSLLGRPAEKKP